MDTLADLNTLDESSTKAPFDPNAGPKHYTYSDKVGYVSVYRRGVQLRTERVSDGLPTFIEVERVVNSLMAGLEQTGFKEVVNTVDPETQARYDALPETIEILGETLNRGDSSFDDPVYYFGEAPFHVEVTFSCMDSWSVAWDYECNSGAGDPEYAGTSIESVEPVLIALMTRHRDTLNSYLSRVSAK